MAADDELFDTASMDLDVVPVPSKTSRFQPKMKGKGKGKVETSPSPIPTPAEEPLPHSVIAEPLKDPIIHHPSVVNGMDGAEAEAWSGSMDVDDEEDVVVREFDVYVNPSLDADTKMIKLIRRGLQEMVISEKWNTYKEDDVGKAKFVKEKLLDDDWWEFVEYILSFTASIYDMLRACDTDKPCLQLVYDMWDSMIEKVKQAIYKHERKKSDEESTFYYVVHEILVNRWNKNNTPLHCLAHSLNPKYYSDEWLNEDPNRIPSHMDEELARERNKCFNRFFDNISERTTVTIEYGLFSGKSGPFFEHDSIHNRAEMEPYTWWCAYGAYAPTLQKIALRLLMQPASSSCCERNLSTYSFVHSVKKNKMIPQ